MSMNLAAATYSDFVDFTVRFDCGTVMFWDTGSACRMWAFSFTNKNFTAFSDNHALPGSFSTDFPNALEFINFDASVSIGAITVHNYDDFKAVLPILNLGSRMFHWTVDPDNSGAIVPSYDDMFRLTFHTDAFPVGFTTDFPQSVHLEYARFI